MYHSLLLWAKSYHGHHPSTTLFYTARQVYIFFVNCESRFPQHLYNDLNCATRTNIWTNLMIKTLHTCVCVMKKNNKKCQTLHIHFNMDLFFSPHCEWRSPFCYKQFLLTSNRSSLLVRTQFSSGKVSHRLSNVAMLSLQKYSIQIFIPEPDILIINDNKH